MSMQALKDLLPEFAKDIRLNLSAVLTPEGSPGLSAGQLALVALASACATRQAEVLAAVEADTADVLGPVGQQAAKAAAVIMAMNNVYYRFTHLVSDPDYRALPARLRMQVIGNPGVPKVDFELACLAVSAINGCGSCIESHAHQATAAGLTKEAVQSAVRIAAVLQAAAQALSLLPQAQPVPR